MPAIQRTPPFLFDGLALTLSGLCLLHCLAGPLLLAMLPAMGLGLLAQEDFHLWMLFAALPSSLLALALGCRAHRNWRLAAWAAAGLGLMTLAAGGGALAVIGEPAERLLTSAGGVLLAVTHVRNYHHCRRQRTCS